MEFGSFITQSLTNASSIARDSFGTVWSTVKGNDNNQVLTKTDLEIGATLIAAIQRQFPHHNIIDEEAGVISQGSEYTWVIDPIDGTSNFASGVPLYGIMLGLLKNNTPIAGGIALSSFNQIYVAEKGAGAYCNAERIYVTPEKSLSQVLVAYGIDGHMENPSFTTNECALLAQIVMRIRNLRTSNSVFDTTMVATGKYGAVLNRTSKVWDNVAQHILIEEAGGIYTDFFGNAIDYSRSLSHPEANFTLLAASPVLHAELLGIIHSFA